MEKYACSWIVRLNIFNSSILPKVIYRFSAISVRILTEFFVETDKLILKSGKGYRIAKTVLEKKKKVGRPTLPNFKSYSKAAVIKTVWYWQKDRNIHQRKRIEKCKNKPIPSMVN